MCIRDRPMCPLSDIHELGMVEAAHDIPDCGLEQAFLYERQVERGDVDDHIVDVGIVEVSPQRSLIAVAGRRELPVEALRLWRTTAIVDFSPSLPSRQVDP